MNMAALFDNEYLSSLAHETPFFLFSKEAITKSYDRFAAAFPDATIAYAIKANSESGVLRTLADHGVQFEIASKYELDLVRTVGVPGDRIIYGTSVKPAVHIKEFVEYGVDRFAFDSLSELEKIAAAAPNSKVYARAVVDDSGSVFKLSGKFGTPKENIPALLVRARNLGLVPWGVSFHVGSQALNPHAWAEAIESLKSIIEELEKEHISIEILNIGGGFPHAYPSSLEIVSLEEIAATVHSTVQTLPSPVQLVLEPGRAIVAGSAILVTTVIARIERSDGTWLFLDAGAYNALFESMAFQGSTRYPITLLRSSYDAGESIFTLTGPTGDSIDTLTHEARLPADADVGDKLIFHDVGAYSTCLSSSFNGFPKPAVYFV
jgi:ornithine decarboxylase